MSAQAAHLQVQCVYVEDVLECVAIIGKEIAPVRITSTLMQVVVLFHQALQLRLH